MKRRGFTLIELLVVIAIIAILAAILFPVFAKAREKARTSACSNNAKQIGVAFLQYVQDFDEKYPPYDTDTVSGRYGWVMLIQPYIKSTQVFVCPSDTAPANQAASGGWLTAPGNIRTSYIYNWMIGPTPSGIAMAAIVSPSTTVGYTCGGVQTSATPPYVTPTSTLHSSSWVLADPRLR